MGTLRQASVTPVWRRALTRLASLDLRPLLARLPPGLRRLVAGPLPYAPDHIGKKQWEELYAGGEWDYLWRVEELARYSLVVGYCQFYKPLGAILDVGCGEGILQARLGPLSYSRYVGVDSSAESISRALRRHDEKTEFIVAEAADYIPACRFDLIIFNESLYYFAEPLGMVRHYEAFLNEDAVFVISMYEKEKTMLVWKELERVYRVEDAVRATNRLGQTWVVKVLAPEESPARG